MRVCGCAHGCSVGLNKTGSFIVMISSTNKYKYSMLILNVT